MNKVYAFIAFFAVLLLGVNAQIQDPVRFVVEQKEKVKKHHRAHSCRCINSNGNNRFNRKR